MTDLIADRDTLLKTLHMHRGDVVCYDHPDDYCCTCGAHQVGGYREHLADLLLFFGVAQHG